MAVRRQRAASRTKVINSVQAASVVVPGAARRDQTAVPFGQRSAPAELLVRR